IGSFVNFNILLAMLVGPLRMLGMWIGQAQRATASGERIFEILDQPEEIAERLGARQLPGGGGRIRFRELVFEYEPGLTVLDGVDLEIEPGRTGALIRLSGGQRQRIAIARALLVDPRILILDDATASVDATTEAQIRLGLREAMQGRTTLIIAHRLSTIALADELVVLEEGRVAARGTHEELLESSPVYHEIYEHGLLERQVMDA